MALLPGRQFTQTTSTTNFIGSVQASFFYRFNFTRPVLLRYNSSFSFKMHTLHPTYKSLTLYIHRPHQNNPNLVFTDNTIVPQYNPNLTLCHSISSSCGDSSTGSGGNWIDKWSEPKKQKLPKQPQAVLNYRHIEHVSRLSYANGGGGGSDNTMVKVVEKLRKYGYIADVSKKKKGGDARVLIEKGSIEDIFYVEEGMLPNVQGGFSKDSPLGVEDVFRGSDGVVRFPWEKKVVKEREDRDCNERSERKASMAELTLSESELRRLKNLAVQTKHMMKIGNGGVTQAVVEMIHDKWKTAEIVRLKIEGSSSVNMRRMHEILEKKTSGMVIWRSGTSICLYRGATYENHTVNLNKIHENHESSQTSFSTPTVKDPHAPRANLEASEKDKKEGTEPLEEVKYENEMDKLLDSLGPRYIDWPGCGPLPVDADLLPGIVPGFDPPFRILPYGMRPTLGEMEATNLKRVARHLPPHFALGRSKQLQGLAVAMIKLWDRSSIAKISLKRGVQLTTSERMADNIKKLTGGILLSRNKDFLVFYRGKNFLSPVITEVLLERERLAKSMLDEEEQARLRASAFVTPGLQAIEESAITGSLNETLEADARWAKKLDNRGKAKMMREAEVLRHASIVRKLEQKLALAERKLRKAERALSKVEYFLKPTEPSADSQSITDEERFMLRKIGLRMKAFLLLGRRGVFDGTIENMHLHWKYRELVKIFVNAKTFDEAKNVAMSLEAESGGLLVSIDKSSKGYAIVVFRGKDYQRPSSIRPRNLLTKRKALERFIELQRREALYNHISTLDERVDNLRSELERMEMAKDNGDEELYEKLDSAYSTDGEDTEDEGEEAYLQTFECANYAEDDDPIENLPPETDINEEVKHSAFDPYQSLPTNESRVENYGIGSKSKNMNKRMVEFLRRNNGNVKIDEKEPEKRNKHMISERVRRESQRQSYLALHHMLPSGTKNDKNSIVQTAIAEIKEMKKYKDELLRRNQVLEEILVAKETGGDHAKIRLKIANPSSNLDSMIEVVRCLMDLGLKDTNIHTEFSDFEFSVELEIHSQVEVEDVKKAVQSRLSPSVIAVNDF